ncbi:MAG: YebC/PmpR family DNA-binding transcriptional regulator [Fidelibacterota bacterium]
MAGHSKWAQIKRKKAEVDARRGKVFTRLIKEIAVAARLGGGDERANSRLRQAMLAAKKANMPAENIKRAVQRGTGELPGLSYEQAAFEGYGPGGVAIMLEVMTDNRKRTVAEVRHLFSRYGGHLGESGCVSWMFKKGGLVIVENENVVEDELLESVLEGNGDDFSEAGDVYEITSPAKNLHSVRESLERHHFKIRSVELTMIPTNSVKVEGEDAQKLLRLLDALEEQDDVQKISSNFDMDEAAMVEME